MLFEPEADARGLDRPFDDCDCFYLEAVRVGRGSRRNRFRTGMNSAAMARVETTTRVGGEEERLPSNRGDLTAVRVIGFTQPNHPSTLAVLVNPGL